LVRRVTRLSVLVVALAPVTPEHRAHEQAARVAERDARAGEPRAADEAHVAVARAHHLDDARELARRAHRDRRGPRHAVRHALERLARRAAPFAERRRVGRHRDADAVLEDAQLLAQRLEALGADERIFEHVQAVLVVRELLPERAGLVFGAERRHRGPHAP
jgi:hypothetical protein